MYNGNVTDFEANILVNPVNLAANKELDPELLSELLPTEEQGSRIRREGRE
jgi:hypothetical protein